MSDTDNDLDTAVVLDGLLLKGVVKDSRIVVDCDVLAAGVHVSVAELSPEGVLRVRECVLVEDAAAETLDVVELLLDVVVEALAANDVVAVSDCERDTAADQLPLKVTLFVSVYSVVPE